MYADVLVYSTLTLYSLATSVTLSHEYCKPGMPIFVGCAYYCADTIMQGSECKFIWYFYFNFFRMRPAANSMVVYYIYVES